MPGNFCISCRIWVFIFLCLYCKFITSWEKSRPLSVVFFFVVVVFVGLSLSSQQCQGFPQSSKVLIWKICCRQVGEKQPSNVKYPLRQGRAPRERGRAPGQHAQRNRKKCVLMGEAKTSELPAETLHCIYDAKQISLLLFTAFLRATCSTLHKKIIIFWERESACAPAWSRWGGAEGQEERESQAGSMPSMEPQAGSQSYDPEIMTWAKIKSWMLNWLSHSGTPQKIHFRVNY